jgi:hypothetical protein
MDEDLGTYPRLITLRPRLFFFGPTCATGDLVYVEESGYGLYEKNVATPC